MEIRVSRLGELPQKRFQIDALSVTSDWLILKSDDLIG